MESLGVMGWGLAAAESSSAAAVAAAAAVPPGGEGGTPEFSVFVREIENMVCFLKIHCLDLRDITYITLCGYIFEFSSFTFSALVSLLVQAQATILMGFVDALTKFIYTPRILIGAIVENLIFEFEILKIELCI